MSSRKDKIAREEKDWNTIDNAVVESNMFLWKYRKPLITGLVIVILIACGFLGYKYLVLEPQNNAALNALSTGQNYFALQQDSLALYGDGNGYVGFEKIITDYGSTDGGNVAKYYAAISAYNLGDYAKSKNYAQDFKANDIVMQYEVQGLIGDCLVNEGKLEDAVHYFIKAAEGFDNPYYSPVFYKKAGLVYKELKNYDKVIDIFTTIKNKYTTDNTYTNSPIVTESQKYIDEALLLKK